MDFKKGIALYLKELPPLDEKNNLTDRAGGEDSGKEYRFYFGFLDHVPEKDKVFLRITEVPYHKSEGRPQFPEQEQWINTFLNLSKIKATDYWFSHWQFDSEKEAEKFVELLRESNAYEK